MDQAKGGPGEEVKGSRSAVHCTAPCHILLVTNVLASLCVEGCFAVVGGDVLQ